MIVHPHTRHGLIIATALVHLNETCRYILGEKLHKECLHWAPTQI